MTSRISCNGRKSSLSRGVDEFEAVTSVSPVHHLQIHEQRTVLVVTSPGIAVRLVDLLKFRQRQACICEGRLTLAMSAAWTNAKSSGSSAGAFSRRSRLFSLGPALPLTVFTLFRGRSSDASPPLSSLLDVRGCTRGVRRLRRVGPLADEGAGD